ncbi:MAG: glycosyltransferase family 2 protein [Syntrophothermus sp.]
MEWPLVSVITINYDQPEVTCQMLASLQRITYPRFEVIVVDNASPTHDPNIITDMFPGCTMIVSDKNLGFAGGNNLGIRHSKGDYILLLNNDTEVDPGFLEPLVLKLVSNPRIGAVSPKIRFYYEPDIFQYAGLSEINPYTIRSHGIGYRVPDKGQYDHDRQTAYVHGAAMMVPRIVAKKVGLMAEQYFLYYEELDWGIRIRNAGYQLWYVHESVVFHKESVTTGKMSPLKTYYMNRARILYMRRNIHGMQFVLALAFMLLISVPKNLAYFLFSARTNHFRAYFSALLWHIRHLAAKEIHKNPVLR